MWHSFHYTFKMLLRSKSVTIWVIIFPMVLATLFKVMLGNIDAEAFKLDPIPCAVVQNEEYFNPANTAFVQTIDSLNDQSKDRILDVHFVASYSEAQALLSNNNIVGFFELSCDGTPRLTIAPVSDHTDTLDGVKRTVLYNISNSYLHVQAMLQDITQNNPAALPKAVNSLANSMNTNFTRQISITANPSSQSVRYSYALLGFACIMSTSIALIAIVQTQANLSSVGARRSFGFVSRTRTLIATIGASWLLGFICLLIAFCYMRFILQENFGGREALCILGILVGSLMATALGACIGAIPKLSLNVKDGIITALTCFLSLFAGLYGSPSMHLGDTVAHAIPWAAAANPARTTSDLFYSLYFYTSLTPFFECIAILLLTTAVFTGIAALLMRRQRYASI